MKRKLIALIVPVFFLLINSNAQYKDLEGVFFGKVIAFGAGGGVQMYKGKQMGSTVSVTPLVYSVFLNNKVIASIQFSLHGKMNLVYKGNDGFTNYTQTANYKFIEIESSVKVALTVDGIEKPTSVFFTLCGGSLLGGEKAVDSRYGEIDNDVSGKSFVGAGFTLYQSLGSRLLLFAEPTYRFAFQPGAFKSYLGDNQEMPLKFSHFKGHAGIIFLVGRGG